MLKFIALLLVAVLHAEARKLPAYLVPCKRSDRAAFNKCAVENGKAAIPTILKGDKNFKLPSLLPLHLERIDISPGPSLSVKLSDITLLGLDSVQLKDIDMDFDAKHGIVKLYFEKVNIESKYEINGKISVLPIKGTGDAHLSFEGLDISYMFDYGVQARKDGKEYVDSIKPTVTFTTKQPHFQFDNLFEGDKALGEQTNKFLNENSRDVLKDLGSSVSEAISAVCTDIIQKYTKVVPYEEVFLL